MTDTRPVRILRALAASPDGLTAPGLVAELAEGIEPRQQALTWYGSILRDYSEKGLTVRAGRTGGGWQRCPAVIYRITDEGLARLAYVDDEPNRKAAFDKALTEAGEAASRRHAALAQAAQAYSRATPRDDRRAVALHLRNLGCTLEEIGQLFGVSREMIRQDLLPVEPRADRLTRAHRLTEVFTESDVMVVRLGKRTLYFTRAEAQKLAEAAAGW
jgi:DNA-binding PadR family transcriptional regulator